MLRSARVTAGVLSILSILALTNLAFGWYLGFRSVVSYLVFWLLCGFVVATSLRLARRAFGATGAADTSIRTAILAFALIVMAGFTLGSLGLVGRIPYLLFFAGCFAASRLLKGDAREPTVALKVPIVLAAVVVPALAFVIAVGAMESPLTLYDSLSYHLSFPARWLQEHRLSIIATPFSDEAQAYAPANGELVFLWLMLPFHGDFLARVGQLPFYLLGGVTLYALARRMGAMPEHAAYAPVFYWLSRPIVEQSVGADVDLICWGMFLTSLYIGIVAVDSNARRDWALWGISLGLYWGSKYVSLVYSPVLLLLPLIRGPRLRALWAVPGILVFAAPWYLRNWAIAGSPIYPSSLAVAGVTLAQGAYSRAAMLNSVFHTTDPRLFPVMLSHAFGTPLFLFWVPCFLGGAWMMWRTRTPWPARLLLLMPIAMVPLYWIGVPDNVDSRFLLPVAILALLPLAFLFRTNRVWNAVVHTLFAAAVVWLLVGWHGELPVALPWYMGGWLSLEGILARRYLVGFIGLAGIAAGLTALLPDKPHRAVPALVALVGASSLTLAVALQTWCAPGRCALLQISPTFIRAPMLLAWQWAGAHIMQTTIAYTGNNVPYPLFGDHLTNRVYYVNIDRHTDWRFHDYERAHRRRADEVPPASVLAVSSGVLQPLPGPARWWVDAVRPRYERMEGNRDAWIVNLKSLGVGYLFVSALSAYEIDYVWHNGAGFPIEDDWARLDPDAFTVIYENPQVRIYAVRAR
jgi:hypothetical protein